MKRLWINDIEIDLDPKTVIAVSRQVNELAELKDRNVDTVYTTKVPRSQENLYKLGYPDKVNSDTVIPYRKNKARLVMNGIEIVSDGFAIIEDIGESISVTIMFGLADFFKLIETKYISDLDLSSFNHYRNLTTIASSRANSTGIYYPLCCYTDDPAYMDNSPARTVDVKRNFPCLYIHNIVEKIFSEAGFELAGDFFSTDFYQKLLLQFSTEKSVKPPKLFRIEKSSTVYDSLFFNHEDRSSGNPLLQTGNFDITGDWTDTDFVLGQDYNVPGDLKIHWSGAFTAKNYGPGDLRYRVQLVYYGPAGRQVMNTIFSEWLQPGAIVNRSYDFWLPKGLYQTGAGRKIRIEVSRSNNTSVAEFLQRPGSYVDGFADAVEIAYGDVYALAPNAPKITQKDFLKAIFNIAAITPQRDRFARKINTATFNQIAKNKAVAKDWSDKLHVQRDSAGGPFVEIDYHSGKYGQVNVFRYKKDQNVPDDTGEGSFAVDDQTLNEFVTAVELPFAASDNVEKLDGCFVPRIHRWDDDKGTPTIKCEPRILIADIQTGGVGPYALSDITLTDGTATPDVTISASLSDSFPFARFLDKKSLVNLGWDNSLIPDFYGPVRQMLDRSKRVKVWMNLSERDVDELDHFIPVYISYFSSFFYVAKVENFKGSGTLTRVHLIKLDGSVGYPFDQNGAELLDDPGLDNPGSWLHTNETGDDTGNLDFDMTGGAIVLTVSSPGNVINESWRKSLSGSTNGNYIFEFKTGHVDSAITSIPGSNSIIIGFGGYSWVTAIQTLLPNTTYTVVAVATGLTGVSDSLVITGNLSGTGALSGGEYIEITDLSIRKI